MNYTSIEQSIRLEKLGLDIMTADMFYNEPVDETYPKDIIVDTKYPMVIREGQKHHLLEYGVPCWSLTALLELMPNNFVELTKDGGMYRMKAEQRYYSCLVENPVDAAFEMIVYLIEKGHIKTK